MDLPASSVRIAEMVASMLAGENLAELNGSAMG